MKYLVAFALFGFGLTPLFLTPVEPDCGCQKCDCVAKKGRCLCSRK